MPAADTIIGDAAAVAGVPAIGHPTGEARYVAASVVLPAPPEAVVNGRNRGQRSDQAGIHIIEL